MVRSLYKGLPGTSVVRAARRHHTIVVKESILRKCVTAYKCLEADAAFHGYSLPRYTELVKIY